MANEAEQKHVAQAALRNLIMVYCQGYLDPRDFEAIREKIEARVPDVQVFIVQDSHLAIPVRKKAAMLPTFIFSPCRLKRFRPERGRIYAGRRITKEEQMRRLVAAGIPVPGWTLLTAETKLDPDEWGPYVILKPSAFGAASLGRGVEVKRTTEVAYREPGGYPDDHPGRRGSMIVQRYVDIVRDRRTGELCVLELNCTSSAWRISSNYFAAFRTGPMTKDKMIAKFGAWEIAAAALIERTRCDAL